MVWRLQVVAYERPALSKGYLAPESTYALESLLTVAALPAQTTSLGTQILQGFLAFTQRWAAVASGSRRSGTPIMVCAPKAVCLLPAGTFTARLSGLARLEHFLALVA
jgi:hypothetical protein